MIAARPFQDFTRNLGRNAFDLPVAGLAALAVAFVAFSMPGELLGRLIDATGLPSLVSAAAPPLGMKARLGLGLVGAVLVFALVFFTLRRLDRKPSPRPFAAAPEPEAPKLRRRDSHPDAPARRPISAMRDLGEPAPPERELTAQPEQLLVEPLQSVVLTPEPESVAPEPEPQAEPLAAVSLDELMKRLEQGLARRRAPRPAAAPKPAAPMPQVFPEAGDARLQSAIESLQRLAARTD